MRRKHKHHTSLEEWAFPLVVMVIAALVMGFMAGVAVAAPLPGPYIVKSITEWRDADTFEADVYVWPGSPRLEPMTAHEAIRIRGLNATEKRCQGHDGLMVAAKEWMKTHGPVAVTNVERDNFGRILADVVGIDGASYRDDMLKLPNTGVYVPGASRHCVGGV